MSIRSCLHTLLLASLPALGQAGTTSGTAAAPAATPDAKAIAVADRLLAATGGADAPYRAERIAFTFAVERDGQTVASRRHVWHPRTGAHSVTGKSKDGSEYAFDWNINDRTGKAVRAGKSLEGEELKAALEQAWGMWVNDTYWLLVPYKLRDPGVRLAWEGEVTEDGVVYDKLRLTFDQVGLTPGDTYWLLVGRDKPRVERWEFVLQGQQPPPSAFRWTDHQVLGGLHLSLRKEKVGGAQAIVFRDVEVR